MTIVPRNNGLLSAFLYDVVTIKDMPGKQGKSISALRRVIWINCNRKSGAKLDDLNLAEPQTAYMEFTKFTLGKSFVAPEQKLVWLEFCVMGNQWRSMIYVAKPANAGVAAGGSKT